MGKSENLKMLYLLTYADIKAVGPDVWTEWKALLLQELYDKTFSILERGDFKLEARSERVKNAKRKVVEIRKRKAWTSVKEMVGRKVVEEDAAVSIISIKPILVAHVEVVDEARVSQVAVVAKKRAIWELKIINAIP